MEGRDSLPHLSRVQFVWIPFKPMDGVNELNQIVQDAVMRHAPPSKAGKRLKFLYVSQVAVDPPTFVFFVNDERLVHFSYERYLENCLRERYEFLGTPLRLSFRKRKRGES